MKSIYNLFRLIKFLDRDDWEFHFETVLAEHFWPIMDEFDLEFEDIGDLLGEPGADILWGVAFEDVLTQVFDPGGKTFVDAYLKSRGFKERAQTKAYIKALSVSVMSLYEVSDIVAGESFRARDLIGHGEPVLVRETAASTTLRPWERIAARIIPIGDKNIIAGGMMPFTQDATDALLEGLKAASGKRSRSKAKPLVGHETLRVAAPLFTHAFLFDVLPVALGEMLTSVQNSDGDDILFNEVHFPISIGITHDNLADRLDGIADLRLEQPRFWVWISPPSTSKPFLSKAPESLATVVSAGDDTAVLGHLALRDRTLVLSVNSAARAATGTALLENVLGKMVGTPLSKIQTIEQMMATSPSRDAPHEDMPPEVQRRTTEGLRRFGNTIRLKN